MADTCARIVYAVGTMSRPAQWQPGYSASTRLFRAYLLAHPTHGVTVLTPNDGATLAVVERRLLAYDDLYTDTARPVAWQCTRAALLRRLAHRDLAEDA